MKLEIVPFQKDHWYTLRLSGRDAEALTGLPDAEHARMLATGGPAYSVFADGEIIGMGGVFMHWPGVGEAWALVSPEAKKHGIPFARAARRYLDQMAKDRKLERVQAAVQADFEDGLKFTEALGFRAEGLMEKFFHGKTFVRFAKFYEMEDV